MKKILDIMIVLLMAITMTACSDNSSNGNNTANAKYEDAHLIMLNGDSATIDGIAIDEYDYTWHSDPSKVQNEVVNAPAEYYTGTKPETDATSYIDHELYYYPELPEESFKLVNYDGEMEWAYYYCDGENENYIFATLPAFESNSIPNEMMHSEEEAAQNKVLHITKAGTYILEGSWDGQILIDLGAEEETFTDENAKVKLVLNGVNINCTVAPALIFDDLYECDNAWEEKETYPSTIDTANAGASVIIADDSDNTISGQNIYRMLLTKYKNDDSSDAIKTQKKARKIDAPLYSYVTMNINSEEIGTGTLTINSSFEGLGTELHLSILGGNISINSANDGINVNEDNVSIASFNGGNLTINAGSGAEGDGIDSNGYIVIAGATININGVTRPDSAIDSEDGITFTAGKIFIDGEEYATEETFLREISSQNQGFGGRTPGNSAFNKGEEIDLNALIHEYFEDFDIKSFKQAIAELDDDATIEDVLELLGVDLNTLSFLVPGTDCCERNDSFFIDGNQSNGREPSY